MNIDNDTEPNPSLGSPRVAGDGSLMAGTHSRLVLPSKQRLYINPDHREAPSIARIGRKSRPHRSSGRTLYKLPNTCKNGALYNRQSHTKFPHLINSVDVSSGDGGRKFATMMQKTYLEAVKSERNKGVRKPSKQLKVNLKTNYQTLDPTSTRSPS